MSKNRKKTPVKVYEPTPEEIAEACREIRAGWSEGMQRMRDRQAGAAPQPVEMREVSAVDALGKPFNLGTF